MTVDDHLGICLVLPPPGERLVVGGFGFWIGLQYLDELHGRELIGVDSFQNVDRGGREELDQLVNQVPRDDVAMTSIGSHNSPFRA